MHTATTKTYTTILRGEKNMAAKNLLRILLFLVAVRSLATGDQIRLYDGSWWRSTNEEQHRGWLAGYIDCSVINGKTELGFISWYTLEPEVSSFYASNPSRNTPVSKVLINIVASSRKPKPGERTQVHSAFDGDYWRQAYPEHRLGYIQGFLTCHSELNNKKARFSKPPSWYASQISRWFGIQAEDPGEINSNRENVPISNVLFKFKDPTRKPGAKHGATSPR